MLRTLDQNVSRIHPLTASSTCKGRQNSELPQMTKYLVAALGRGHQFPERLKKDYLRYFSREKTMLGSYKIWLVPKFFNDFCRALYLFIFYDTVYISPKIKLHVTYLRFILLSYIESYIRF